MLYVQSYNLLFVQNSLISQPPEPADSPGRSGAKFFISHDKKLVIKSITTEEVALLHLMLQAYHAVSIIEVFMTPGASKAYL